MGLKASILLLAALFVAPAQQPSPSLTGIAHVALRVADLQKSREFYRTLGFEQAFEFADPGKAPVSYMKVNDRQFIELYQRSDDSQPLGLMHVCYESNDIEALHDSYVQRGVAAPAAKKARAGNLLFSLHDPENRTLEFTQYMPGSLHFEDRGKHLGEHRISQHILRVTIAVKNHAAEREFYTSKLGFEETKAKGVLRIPGSGDSIELEIDNSSVKERLVFSVANIAPAAEDLRKRGLPLSRDGGSVTVTDPDGTVVIFTH